MSKFFLAILITLVTVPAEAATIKCADFNSWAEAQKAYESNPVKYRNLDRDKDGIACEALQR